MPRGVGLIGGLGALGLILFVASDDARVRPRAPAHEPSEQPRVKPWPRLPLSFEPNVGQAAPAAQFVVHIGRAVALLSSDGVVTAVPVKSGPTSLIRMALVGAARVTGEPQDELPGKANYFIGNDPSQWHAGVRTFARVLFRDAWPGVDVVWHGEGDELEYDFVVHPAADVRRIRLAFEGATVRREGGNLLLAGAGQALTLRQPATYQDTDRGGVKRRSSVETQYDVSGSGVGFRVEDRDDRLPLVIDPVLSYSTYLGGSSEDYGTGIAVDSSGSAYVTGFTASTDFPTRASYQPSLAGSLDAFVAKLSASGSSLVYSTYFGGIELDRGNGIAVDASGNAYITGDTYSQIDFPLQGALQPKFGGGARDAFVTKLNAAGSALLYSTYLGGSGDEYGNGIALNGSGNAYVTGSTTSTDFPTAGPLQAASGGNGDAFVAQLNAMGSALVYSTYLGGGQWDVGSGIAVDGSGNAGVVGWTSSVDFPTANPIQAALGGVATDAGSYIDAFVAKLNPSGSSLIYSTYLGGSGTDLGGGIAMDALGNAYVSGITDSPDFPIRAAFQPRYGGGGDAFVAKLDATGSSLAYSTYLGGSYGDFGLGIAVDAFGNAYVTGATSSLDFPTMNPLPVAHGGGYGDPFALELNASGSALIYSTYLDTLGNDNGNAIALDAMGNVYITGDTTSTTFPTVTPVQATFGGGPGSGPYDAYVLKLCCDAGAAIVVDGGANDGGAADGGAADGGAADGGAAKGLGARRGCGCSGADGAPLVILVGLIGMPRYGRRQWKRKTLKSRVFQIQHSTLAT